MKSKKIVPSIIILVVCMVTIFTVTWLTLSDVSSKTVYDFMIYSMLVPAVACFICLLVIGLINRQFSIVSIYSVLMGVGVSVLSNIVVLTKVDEKAIQTMIDNTSSTESLTITTSNAGVSSIITSVLVFAVISAIGGAIGIAIGKGLVKKAV